jgi:pilus assembly protein CpaF
MVSRMFFDLPGIRPIRHLLLDPEVNEVMINGPAQVYVERAGRTTLEPVTFESDTQLRFLIETLLRPSNRWADAKTPCADGRLPDGSRVNVVLPPVALNGPTVTIRKFTRAIAEVHDLVRLGTLSPRMAAFLVAAVKARLNIVFCGATGAGKTTTLGLLSRHIPERERVLLIEDTAELELLQPHVVRLECRAPNVEGEGAIDMRQLLRNALRMRPTRIIVGEVRGDEAVEMLQAIASGHDGCLSVLHAGSPSDAVLRLESMVTARAAETPLWSVHRQIAAGVDLFVQHEVMLDGKRRVTRITEVAGVESQPVSGVHLRTLFEFDDHGPDDSGTVRGRFLCAGVEPGFLARFARHGVKLPPGMFEPGEA